MQVLRQMGGGLIIAIVSLLLVIGGITLSLAETSSTLPNTPTPIPSPTQIPELFAPTSNLIATPTHTETPTNTPTETTISPTACPVPAGWSQIVVGANDTLYTIAERYKTTTDQLSTANCLTNLNLSAGSLIYVPPVPTVTVIPCGPPAGWVKTHRVQSGDNLFRIALSYGISYPQLQRANCMGSSTTIYAGQLLWVPNIPTRTPAVTSTNIPAPTNTTAPTSTIDFSTSTKAAPTFDSSTPSSTFVVTSTPMPTSTTAATATLSLTQNTSP
jgi:LysM repeat protein